jgi:four helix bundle protein
MENFRKCNVWEKSRILLLSIYKVADSFPKNERVNIGICMKNCCVANLSNVMKLCNFRKHNSVEKMTQLSISIMDRLKEYLENARNQKLLKSSDFEYLTHEANEIKCLLTYNRGRSIHN